MIVGGAYLVQLVIWILVLRFSCDEVGPDHPDFDR